MNPAFVIIIMFLSILAWLGQVMSAIAPQTAMRLGLTENKKDVDPIFSVDIRAECIWDALTLWILPAATGLHLAGNPSWPLFALTGGGVYLYFAGRGIIQRILMQRHGVSIGTSKTVMVFSVFLGLWGTAGLAAILMGSFELLRR